MELVGSRSSKLVEEGLVYVPIRRSGSRSVWFVALSLAVSICACGPPWKVIEKSGPPSALRSASSIAVSFDYSKVKLGGRSEADYLADKSDEDKEKLREVKFAANSGFFNGLTRALGEVTVYASQPPFDVGLRVEYTRLEQGKYIVIYAASSRIDAELVFTRGGEVVDRVAVKSVVPADMHRPTILERMRVAGHELAALAARYYREAQER